MNICNEILRRSYGLEHKFLFYALRRGAGAAFNNMDFRLSLASLLLTTCFVENMAVAERMQAIGHNRPEIYDKYYLNELIDMGIGNLSFVLSFVRKRRGYSGPVRHSRSETLPRSGSQSTRNTDTSGQSGHGVASRLKSRRHSISEGAHGGGRRDGLRRLFKPNAHIWFNLLLFWELHLRFAFTLTLGTTLETPTLVSGWFRTQEGSERMVANLPFPDKRCTSC